MKRKTRIHKWIKKKWDAIPTHRGCMWTDVNTGRWWVQLHPNPLTPEWKELTQGKDKE
jgi:hypothetical protein